MIAVIDGCGANVTSVMFALQRLGCTPCLTTDHDMIREATQVILPGVGTAGYAMQQLEKNNLVSLIKSLTQPVLGICLGMQLLFEFSEEDDVDCMGIIPGQVKKINNAMIVPHMGWNQLTKVNDDALLNGIDNGDYVYFVHSYVAPVNEFTLAVSEYPDPFAAIVKKDNFIAAQFHPEKSGITGETILRNFISL